MYKHPCKVPGCGKAFSRPSHLQRHALNHTTTQWECERCSACFKRLDLLERHKARHASRDKAAGGVGLGVLETKGKHFKPRVDTSNISSARQQLATPESPSQPSLSLSVSLDNAPSVREDSNHDHSPSHNDNNTSNALDHGDPTWNENEVMQGSIIDAEYFAPHLDFSNSFPSPAQYHVIQSPGIYPIGDMYHDMSFDLVHFNVTGFSPTQGDIILAGSNNAVPPDHCSQQSHQSDSTVSCRMPHVLLNLQPEIPNTNMPIPEQQQNPELASETSAHGDNMTNTRVSVSDGTEGSVPENSLTPPTPDLLSRSAVTGLTSSVRLHPIVADQISDSLNKQPAKDEPGIQKLELLALTSKKREELLQFIAEIRPVRPDGTLMSGEAPEFSLQNLQIYLNLFMQFFNTSYPLVHVPTLVVDDTDPIALLSWMLLGATYKDKDAHQLSVCLYDAIIPHILSGLLSCPVPDLAILQAFVVLEVYGMYRAGSYQRENAILIHGVLLSSIRRISRYHVRARITLPDRLTYKERDWMEFAYAEQYKRLILFFFVWDTQNATCYSFMPSMSVQNLHMGLPCSRRLWQATGSSEWKELLSEHDEKYTLLSLVKKFVDADHEMLSKPYDTLSFNIALHGIMSMANDSLYFDNRSIYLENIEGEDVSWSPWRQQIARSLESWKAKYDAFAMEAIWDMQSEPLHCEFQRDSMALFALYHTVHIVINCEIRHLQAAAGAKAIFGHIVTPSDYEESCKWVRQWVLSSPASAGRAAWHAAQMFREGMLNLLNWDVHGVFHYSWCLYIGTLTCWAFHHFGAETTTSTQVCDHAGPAKGKELKASARCRMNHLVATMASVTPANMDRVMGNCCTHGLTFEMAKYLKGIRWTAAYEAMKVLERLSGLPGG